MKNISFQRIDSKNKKLKITVIMIVFLLCVGVIAFMIKKTHSVASDSLLENQVVDSLSFENAKLEYADGISTFSVEVYNESNKIYNLKKIEIFITDNSDEEIRLVGYIGESLEEDEGRYLTTSVDADLTSARKIRYVINK